MRACLLAALIALAAAGIVRADTILRDYLDRHPDLAAEDLLDVSQGDTLARVLAVIHHGPAALRPARVRILELTDDGPREIELPGLDAEISKRSWLVAVSSSCEPAVDGDLDSWFYLPKNRLAAWSLQPYTRECRLEPPLVEASEHAAMRTVGDHLFRRLGRGVFRYGSLSYERWHDAFAAPTRKATLSRLQMAAESRPDDPRVWNRLAVVLYASGDAEGSLEALRRAAGLDPNWQRPHRNLAVVHLQLGETEAARRAATHADSMGRRGVSAPSP